MKFTCHGLNWHYINFAAKLSAIWMYIWVVKGELFNMTRAWDKERIWVPNRNGTHDLLNTGWVSGLSTEQVNSWRARWFNRVHIFFVQCHVDQFTFHISLPSYKFTIFIYLSLHMGYYWPGWSQDGWILAKFFFACWWPRQSRGSQIRRRKNEGYIQSPWPNKLGR